MTLTKKEAVELLRRRIKQSGLKSGAFARDVLIREPRTVRRWLSEDAPIPQRVLEWLQEPRVAPWPPPALADVPKFDRQKLAEEVSDQIVAELRGRMQDSGVCDVCGGEVS